MTSDLDTDLKGHGGSLFRIRMHDGTLIDSRNLWCQGPIPERFRDRLYDNAEFLPEDHSRTEAGFLKAIFFEGPEGEE